MLGSIEVTGEGDIALGGAIQRRILALLALEAGEVVSLDEDHRAICEQFPL